jgi:hypothetical protein
MPKLSIGIPVFNGQEFLPELLDSLLAQTFRDFEIRFHAHVSSALSHKELKRFLSTDGKRYSRRLRQIKAFFGAPRGKLIGVVSKSVCFMLVAAHSAKITVQLVGQNDPRRAAHGADGYGWPGTLAPGLRRRTPG